jgi:hypothetical protein
MQKEIISKYKKIVNKSFCNRTILLAKFKKSKIEINSNLIAGSRFLFKSIKKLIVKKTKVNINVVANNFNRDKLKHKLKAPDNPTFSIIPFLNKVQYRAKSKDW